MTAALAVSRHQLRILRSDPGFLVIMFLMPLAIMPIMRDALGINLVAAGFTDADGAEQVVPGQLVMFGFFVAGSVSFSLFREHGWKTWDRIRASATSPLSLLAGFAIPWVVIFLLYQMALLFVGGLLFGLDIEARSTPALGMVLLGFSLCAVSLMLLFATTLRTVNQVQAIQNVGAIAFAGIGGALVPHEQLPGWAQAIAPITPQYWAMQGFRKVFLQSGGVGDVAKAFWVLLGIAVIAGILGVKRFRADETKEFFA